MKKTVVILVFALSSLVFGQDAEKGKASGDKSLPPIPPGRKYVVEAVFNRFPGVDRDEVIKLARENFAAKMQEIEKLSTFRPNDAVEQMTEVVYEVVKLLEIKASDPELFKNKVKQIRLEKQVARYVEQARAAKGNKRDEALGMLNKTLALVFEVKQEVIKLDLARMERELGRLKEMVEKREENKDLIVNRRARDLLGEMAQVEW